jgi:ankyrin repeat protein
VTVRIIDADEPMAKAVIAAIQAGDVEALRGLLSADPELANARLGAGGCEEGNARSPLHVATDWPGHYPNGPQIVRALVDAGGDVNARFVGPHAETPLHWAASSDDVAVLDALLDAGADIEAAGAVIGGGTAMADATAFGNWKAARRLLERGARTTFFEAATLGLVDRVTECLERDRDLTPELITESFWGACHGGRQSTAALLLERGADLNWIGWDDLTPLDAARRTGAKALVAWLHHRGARSAGDVRDGSA